MFFFNKKQTIAASGIMQGAVDHHSHILPGVDDGIETMDEALQALATYEDLGIKKLWLTPHIMEDIPNTPEKLKNRFAELKATYTGNIELHLAAEYMIDNHLHKLLQDSHSKQQGENSANTLLPIGTRGNHLLVETSFFSRPMRLMEMLELIKSKGFHPLLAHPERYMYMEKAEYLELHRSGVKFQLNLASLAGGYGQIAKKNAKWLLYNDLYTVCGSDLHCKDGLKYITECKLSKQDIKLIKCLLHNGI